MIAPIAFLPLLFLICLVWGLQFEMQKFARFLLVSTTFLTGVALFFSLLPGFSLPIDLSSPPLCINYGRAYMALIFLGSIVSTLTIQKSQDWKIVFGAAIMGALGIFLLILLWKLSIWTPYFSLAFFPWALFALFFTVIPEEVLLRGLLQKECTAWLGKGIKQQFFSVAITSLLYPLFHLSWAGDFSLFLPTLAIGMTLACLYQITRMIEVSIVCHFLILSMHFCFFEKLSFWHQLPCVGFGL